VTSVDDIESDPEAFDLLLELDAADRLPLRVRLFLPIDGDLDAYAKMRTRATPRVELAGVKAFLDGVVESKTAYLLEPYATAARARGAPLIEPARFEALVRAADARGFQVIVHAVGDAAVRLCLDTFAKLPPDTPRGHRVEHIELLALDDAPRFAVLGAVASMQPYHAIPGAPEPDAGAWSENLGAARLARTFVWKALLDAGAELVFGSDWPVFTVDPFQGLAVALTRRDQSGLPAQGWNAQQAIPLDAALAAYGITPARLAEGTDAATLIVVDGVDLDDPRTLWRARVRRLPPNADRSSSQP
jgi:predicted amidohydrolase YtcJ